jgi:glycerophosphoryl diester phosphodiesterase
LPDFRDGKDMNKDFIRSPDNPFLTFPVYDAQNPSNLPRSHGFEGMAISLDKTKLYPLLEGAVAGDPAERLILSEFDLTTEQYTGRQWFYRLETGSNRIGDMTTVNEHQFLVIERDNEGGANAQFKKIFLIDINALDRDGYVVKEEIVDLLSINDPDNIAGFGRKFTFPYECVEGVAILDSTTIIVLNDNNYPNEGERATGVKNNNEFLVLKLEKPLNIAPGIGVK